MTKPLRVLVNGTCFCRGPDSWPYFLESSMQSNMVNLSVAGVGNSYIFETTMREVCRRPYDLVIVTWSTSHHIALRVDDINQFSDSKNTSFYQSSVNDWPEKIVHPINDQDYVEKNWIMNVGKMSGIKDTVSDFFDNFQTYVKFPQSLEQDLTHIISLQSFHKIKNIPYLFVYTRPIKQYERFRYLYDQIDWTKWYSKTTIVEIGQMNGGQYHSHDERGANTEGHRLYANLLHEFIQTNIIVGQNKA